LYTHLPSPLVPACNGAVTGTPAVVECPGASVVVGKAFCVWQALANAMRWPLDDRVHMSVLVASQGLLRGGHRW
jgi:hypothetical protein